MSLKRAVNHMDANCDNPSTSPGGSLSLLHQIFSFTQNGGRRPNICLGPNSGKNDVQRDSQNSTENTSKSFSWDKCCGKINAQTVFTENFPLSIKFLKHTHTQVAQCHLKRFTQLLFLAKEQYEAGVTKQLFCDEGIFTSSFLNVLRWLILNRKNRCCAGA